MVIDKALLEVAGISEETPFQISITPQWLFIQSVEDEQTTLFEEKFKELNKKYSKLMKRLADL